MNISDFIKRYSEGMARVDAFKNLLDSEEKVRILDAVGCQYTLWLGRLGIVMPGETDEKGREISRLIVNGNRIVYCRVGKILEISYHFYFHREKGEEIWKSKNPVAAILVPEKKKIVMHLENFSLAALQA